MLIPPGYTIRFPADGGPAGEHGSVAFDDQTWKDFGNVDRKERAKLEATMKRWCQDGPANLPTARFKNQTAFKKAGKSVTVSVFKAHQVRFYGGVVQVDGQPVFLIIASDTSKKQDKANQALLKFTAEVLHTFREGKQS